jgi:hypothetical protein
MDLGVRDPRMALPAQYGGHIVRRNVVRDCGVCGIAGLRMPDCLVEDNLVEDCCYHDIEEMWESAGIKLHHCEHTVVRRNVVRRIPYGTGIWLDYDNRNMRCTGNTVTQVSSLFGGLFVEASRVPNLVDHNIVVGVHAVGAEGGHGLYAHDTEFLRVEHNLFADCAGCAIYLPKGQADRFVCGRGSCSRGHHVAGNLAVARGGRYLAFQDAANVSTANAWGGQAAAGPFRLLGADEWLDLETWGLFHGLDQDSALVTADAALDPETLELRLTANGLPRNGEAIAGPFPEMPERPVCVDPRVMRGR